MGQVVYLPRHRGDIAGEPGLPPEDAWLIDPEETRLATPVDNRGIVIPQELIETVQSTIAPDYVWPRHLSVHHLYYEGNLYKGSIQHSFRELPVNKALLPRVFENWLHKVMIRPQVPQEEVMLYRIESWYVAKNLFRSVQKMAAWERRARRRELLLSNYEGILPAAYNQEDVIGQEYFDDIIETHFRGIEQNLERLKLLPAEMRLIDPNASDDDLKKGLGKLVVPRALQLAELIVA